MAHIAFAAGISVETLRKIETGRIPTPTFFAMAALARVVDLSLEELGTRSALPDTSDTAAS
jgi:hypothetical protein